MTLALGLTLTLPLIDLVVEVIGIAARDTPGNLGFRPTLHAPTAPGSGARSGSSSRWEHHVREAHRHPLSTLVLHPQVQSD